MTPRKQGGFLQGMNELQNPPTRGRVLLSSSARRWRSVGAELRSHPAGERPAGSFDVNEIVVVMGGTSVVTRQAEGVRERIVAAPGTIGLSPAGIREDFKSISRSIDEMLHIYLPHRHLSDLAGTVRGDAAPTSIDYRAGFRDPLIECIAREFVRELTCETSAGNLLVEALVDALALRLLNSYAGFACGDGRTAKAPQGLDSRRLQRVIDYIDANLAEPISLDDLAAAASLSRFHFSRMFKVATGQSPSTFVGHRRLEMAKRQLAGGLSIGQIALDCGFSSESNFARSFKRVGGMTPGEYWRMARQ
jgi:AraC family transcriptional regulator